MYTVISKLELALTVKMDQTEVNDVSIKAEFIRSALRREIQSSWQWPTFLFVIT